MERGNSGSAILWSPHSVLTALFGQTRCRGNRGKSIGRVAAGTMVFLSAGSDACLAPVHSWQWDLQLLVAGKVLLGLVLSVFAAGKGVARAVLTCSILPTLTAQRGAGR